MKVKSDKVAKFIDKKILPSEILPSIIIFILGAILFFVFINDKNTSGLSLLILIAITYFLLGIGLYGILKWLIKNSRRLFFLLILLIFHGNIQVTVTNGKVSSNFFLK